MSVYFQRKNFLYFILLIWLSFNSYSQTENFDIAGVDSALANATLSLADSLRKTYQYDSSNYYYEKASEIYLTKAKSSGLIDKVLWEKYINYQNQIGWNLAVYLGEIQKAIELLNSTLKTGISKLGKSNLFVAKNIQ